MTRKSHAESLRGLQTQRGSETSPKSVAKAHALRKFTEKTSQVIRGILSNKRVGQQSVFKTTDALYKRNKEPSPNRAPIPVPTKQKKKYFRGTTRKNDNREVQEERPLTEAEWMVEEQPLTEKVPRALGDNNPAASHNVTAHHYGGRGRIPVFTPHVTLEAVVENKIDVILRCRTQRNASLVTDSERQCIC